MTLCAEQRAIAIGVKYVIDLLANPTPEQEAASDNLLADIFDARTYRRRIQPQLIVPIAGGKSGVDSHHGELPPITPSSLL